MRLEFRTPACPKVPPRRSQQSAMLKSKNVQRAVSRPWGWHVMGPEAENGGSRGAVLPSFGPHQALSAQLPFPSLSG